MWSRLPAVLLSALLLVAPGLRAATAPAVFAWPADRLDALAGAADRPGHPLAPAFAVLRAEADKLLRLPPPSVMDKSLCAATGDKHDYFSFAPYWWPDPKKPDGKPYIRRDGAVNPESQQGTDSAAFGKLASAIELLAVAYHCTGHAPYAEQAARLARTWFLAPATRMNPNLACAQAVPGRNNGRGAGVLQGRQLGRIADSLALLGDAPAWTTEDRTAFRRWLEEYYHWLTTAPNAREEEAAENNHGTWFDVQAAHLALVLGRRDEARARLEKALQRRLAAQVEPDGRQPRELERTQSLGYSLFNLEAFFSLARLADRAGLDWWSFSTKDGRSLGAALRYVAPYADPKKPWRKDDLVAADRERIFPLLAEFLSHREDPELRRLLDAFGARSAATPREWELWYAPLPAARN